MALSDREREVLAQLEEQLRQEGHKLEFEPPLAPVPDNPLATQTGGSFGPRVIAAAFFLLLAGLGALLGGVMMGYTWAGITIAVLGFIIGFIAVTLPWNKTAVRLLGGKRAAAKPVRPQPHQPGAGRSFMDRQRDRWDERNQRR